MMLRCHSYHRHSRRKKLPVLVQEVVPFISRHFFSSQTLRNAEEGGGERRDVRVGRGVGSRMVHPWPEWVELLERLVKKGYADESDGFYRSPNRIRTSCLMFARDHFSLYRCLSENDIKVIVESGCPTSERKVVNSGKRLRAHFGINESNVCSSCNLRGSCERAYHDVIHEELEQSSRTIDIFRILITYGLEKSKVHFSSRVEESSRNILSEILLNLEDTREQENLPEPSKTLPDHRPLTKTPESVPKDSNQQISTNRTSSRSTGTRDGDWICKKCDFINFKKNIRCLRCDEISEEKLKKLREDREHLPLKRGDWICITCNFLNFSKNTKCLQCNEKPSARHLGPGEWECSSCYFVNFRRNTACLKCDWKRPKSALSSSSPYFADFQLDGNRENTRTANDQQQQRFRSSNAGFWSSNEERREGGKEGNSVEFTKFEDFPIAGGKSCISKNSYSDSNLKSPNLLDIAQEEEEEEEDDDDDIDDEINCWFDQRKRNKKNIA